MTPVETNSKLTMEKIDQEKAIQTRLKEINLELSEFPNVDNLRLAVGGAKSRLEEHEGNKEEYRSTSGESFGEFESIRKDLELENLEAQKAYAQAKERKETLLNEQATLFSQLKGLKGKASVQEVVRYQQEFTEAETEISNLTSAISTQEQRIDEAKAQIPSMEEQERGREDILAEIATGKATEKELEELDNKIAIDKKTVQGKKENAQHAIAQANQAMVGLTRRLNDTQQIAERLKAEVLPAAKGECFLGHAEHLGEEYAVLAEQLVKKHNQIVALEKIIKSASPLSSDICFSSSSGNFFIPAFQLKTCPVKHSSFSSAGAFFKYQPGVAKPDVAKAQSELIEEFKALGIDL